MRCSEDSARDWPGGPSHSQTLRGRREYLLRVPPMALRAGLSEVGAFTLWRIHSVAYLHCHRRSTRWLPCRLRGTRRRKGSRGPLTGTTTSLEKEITRTRAEAEHSCAPASAREDADSAALGRIPRYSLYFCRNRTPIPRCSDASARHPLHANTQPWAQDAHAQTVERETARRQDLPAPRAAYSTA